jgi:hypothetical protein
MLHAGTAPMIDDDRVAEGLEHILTALEIIAHKAVDPEHYAEVAASEFSVGETVRRAELILRLIKSQKRSRLVMQRRSH